MCDNSARSDSVTVTDFGVFKLSRMNLCPRNVCSGWSGAACGLLLVWLSLTAVVAAELPQEYREFARRLSADDFSARQSAERALAANPSEAALPWLAELARSGDAECSTRAIRILERWMATAPLPLAEQAETQLSELTRDAAPHLTQLATDSLAVHQELRQAWAIEALRELGAKVDMGPDYAVLHEEFNVRHAQVDAYLRDSVVRSRLQPIVLDDELNDPDPQADPPPVAPRESLPSRPTQVFLTSKWQGGLDGIRHLGRLAAPDEGLLVYVVEGCGVSRDDVQAATAELESVSIQERGPSLGVSQQGLLFGGDRCYITRVVQGGAAEQAGIEPGDVIVEMDSERITSFSQLIQKVKVRKLGQTVPVTVLRGGEILEKQVTFGDWAEIDTESELWNPENDGIQPRMFFPPK